MDEGSKKAKAREAALAQMSKLEKLLTQAQQTAMKLGVRLINISQYSTDHSNIVEIQKVIADARLKTTSGLDEVRKEWGVETTTTPEKKEPAAQGEAAA